jgi:hypothetical protein
LTALNVEPVRMSARLVSHWFRVFG